MSELTDWLLERIAEDESDIEGDWSAGDGGLHIISTPMHERMLAECAAKRRILEIHYQQDADRDWRFCGQCSEDERLEPYPCPTVRVLASVYAVDRATQDPTQGESMSETEDTITDRGFRHAPPVRSEEGGTVRAYESSCATGEYVWVKVNADPAIAGKVGEAAVHLTVEQARELAAHLTRVCDLHYSA